MSFAPRTYVDIAELKDALSISGETYADVDMTKAIIAASRYVDDYTHRRFWIDVEPVARYYTATDPMVVVIDDLAEFVELATDEAGDGTFSTVWAVGEWVPSPRNHVADEEPARMLCTSQASPSGRTFPIAEHAVRVTGRFGWPSVPDSVTTATEIIATRILRRVREAPFGVVAMGAEGVPIRVGKSDPEVDGLLRRYVRARPKALFV